MNMAFLQLAENPYNQLADARELYVFVPANFMGNETDLYIREDKFDDLPENEYQILMQRLAPYQNTGLSGKKAEKRKDAKQARKVERLKIKQEGKTERAKTRGEAFKDIAGSVGGILGNIRGRGSVDTGAGQLNVEIGQQQSFFSKYKLPLLIGGIVLVGGGIILATRKTKKR